MVLRAQSIVKGYQLSYDDSPNNTSWLLIDPAFEITHDNPPLCLDGTSGMVRQFSTYATVAAAKADFIGYASSAAWARDDDTGNQKILVIRVGKVEVELDAVATVSEGDTLDPWLDTAPTPDNVSDHVWTPNVGGLLRVCDLPTDPHYIEDPCSSPAAATDTSPSTARAGVSLRRCMASFNTKFTDNV